ncbi:MAG: hypothetical protein PVF76_08145 [Syntrophobacterales bacterium]
MKVRSEALTGGGPRPKFDQVEVSALVAGAGKDRVVVVELGYVEHRNTVAGVAGEALVMVCNAWIGRSEVFRESPAQCFTVVFERFELLVSILDHEESLVVARRVRRGLTTGLLTAQAKYDQETGCC